MKPTCSIAVLGCALALAGCSRETGDPPKQQADKDAGTGAPAIVTTMGAGPSSPVSGKCDGVTPEQSVTLTIRADKGNGDIFKQIGNRSLDFEIDRQYQPKKKEPDYWATDADIAIGDKWTRVTFVLKQDKTDRVKFLRWAGASEDPAPATAAFTVEPSYKNAFCALSSIDTSVADQESFSVMVKLPPRTSTPSVIAAYNLGFLANAKGKTDLYVPVFLDPNMKNEG